MSQLLHRNNNPIWRTAAISKFSNRNNTAADRYHWNLVSWYTMVRGGGLMINTRIVSRNSSFLIPVRNEPCMGHTLAAGWYMPRERLYRQLRGQIYMYLQSNPRRQTVPILAMVKAQFNSAAECFIFLKFGVQVHSGFLESYSWSKLYRK